MPKKFSGILIASDIDGTLITDQYVLPQANIDALQYFTKEGGLFTIVSGRSPEAARFVAEQLPINAPSLHHNGGSVYNYRLEKEISALFLPKATKEYIKKIWLQYPHLLTNVLQDKYYYDVTNSPMPDIVPLISRPATKGNLEELDGDWYKVLFICHEHQRVELVSWLQAQDFPGVDVVPTGACLVEMIPKGVTKGKALTKLAEELGIAHNHVVAVGDYYNDLDMLQSAGVAIVPANAPDDIKKLATAVVCHCVDGALADTVEYIEHNIVRKI